MSKTLPSSTWYQVPNTAITQIQEIAIDEIVTGVSFTGTIDNSGVATTVSIYLCDPTGGKGCLLITKTLKAPVVDAQVTSGNNYGGTSLYDHHGYDYFNASLMNRNDLNLTTFSGSVLCLGRVSTANEGKDVHVGEDVTVTVSLGYKTGNITIVEKPGITVTPAKTSAPRNEAVALTVALDKGASFNGFTVTSTDTGAVISGTITKNTNTSYTFKMPAPAQNVTITPNVEKLEFEVSGKTNHTNVGSVSIKNAELKETSVAIAGDKVYISTTIDIVNDSEYLFTNWNITDSPEIGTDTKGTYFIMPATDTVVEAVYLKHKIEWKVQNTTFEDDETSIMFTNNGYAEDNIAVKIKEMLQDVKKNSAQWADLSERLGRYAVKYYLYKTKSV